MKNHKTLWGNSNLPYMQKLFEKLKTKEEIEDVLNVSYHTIYRWNTGKTRPRKNEVLDKIYLITGYTKEDIQIQYLLYKKEMGNEREKTNP